MFGRGFRCAVVSGRSIKINALPILLQPLPRPSRRNVSCSYIHLSPLVSVQELQDTHRRQEDGSVKTSSHRRINRQGFHPKRAG